MYKFLLLTIASFLCVNPLFSQPQGKTYKDQYLQSLRVPIGGIGTGDILIGGRGNIEHVEIFNRSDRQRRLEKTFFALWTQKGEQPPTAKILEREIFPPFGESTHKYVAGLPRFRDVTFTNHFPLAKWDFQDESVPLQVSMDAFSPFIPLNVDESSYPLVAFYWELKNPNLEPVKGALVLNMENPIKAEEISNQYYQKEGLTGVRFVSGKGANVNYQGNVFIGTTASETEVQTHWYPGEWRDETHAFWDDFSDDGKLKPQTGDWETTYKPTSYNQTTKRMASVLVHFNLKPGQTMRIPMFLSWYFPQREFGPGEVFGIEAAANKPFGNAYGKLFSSEISVLRSFLKKETSLYDQTTTFANILQSSTYPESVKEALTTQAASIRTNLIQVTDKGNVHGFEGVTNGGWCCPGTCTHVWNYEQSLASLFPSLERNMREIEFLNNTFENGFQTHRSVLPIGDYWFPGPAAADGQMGTIVRAYRDWKFSGDDEWLRKIWPGVKRALEFAWTGSGEITEDRFKFQANQNAWDPQQTGLLSGKQHNTYDISFYGPSSMTTSLYLAALKAGAEMALAMGERKKAKEYESVYLKGNNIASDSLWNGEYFIQIVVDNPDDEEGKIPDDPEGFLQNNTFPKYQYGDGCLADQLLGQYLAFNAGLGYVLNEEKVRGAVSSVYKHNFINPLRNFSNVQRVYGLNDEAGVVLCTWPNDNRPPLPFVYSDEIWTGVEYQVAASLIYAGFIDQGLEIVDAIQHRYDGFRRNPFEHDESGVHYARAMASWSLLLALSGIEYDGTMQSLSFDPKVNREDFSTFWSTGSAWGRFEVKDKQAILSVAFGELNLKSFGLKGVQAQVFKKGIHVSAGEELVLDLK